MKYGTGKLCPFSFGLALGLTAGIAVLVCAAWQLYGLPTIALGHMMPLTTFSGAWILAGACFLKGFLAGFVFALLYDMILCCCKGRKANGCSCNCGCPSCSCGPKSTVN